MCPYMYRGKEGINGHSKVLEKCSMFYKKDRRTGTYSEVSILFGQWLYRRKPIYARVEIFKITLIQFTKDFFVVCYTFVL